MKDESLYEGCNCGKKKTAILLAHSKKQPKLVIKRRPPLISDTSKLHEKFTENSNPIKDFNIGMIHNIKKFVKENGYEYVEEDLLWICAQEGKVEFVKYLLDAGADVHANNDLALRLASEYGHTEIVKLLLDAGANVHVNDNRALRVASEKGHTEIVKLLLDAKANVHARGDYALQRASYYGRTEVVKLLLDAGADVHIDDDYALRWASANGHTEVVKLLKDHIAKEKGRVKESLNEKFEEESDPIKDLGIGVITFKSREDVYEWISENLPAILGTKEMPEDILNDTEHVGDERHYILKKYLVKLREYGSKHIKLKIDDKIVSSVFLFYPEQFHLFLKNKYPYLKSWMIKESLYEKFTEDSDPIHDLGIGIRLKDLIKINDIKKKAYGNKWEEERLATTMAKLITDPTKAFRRCLAAKNASESNWEVTKIFLKRAKYLGNENALKIKESKKYNNMKKLNESRYDVKAISNIAVYNLTKWINVEDLRYFRSELDKMHSEDISYDDIQNLFYEFFDSHIDKFFRIFSAYNTIEKEFLEDHRDEIIENIADMFTNPDSPLQQYTSKNTAQDLTKGSGEIDELIKKSEEKKKEPKEYSKMSQYELQKAADDAIEKKDYDTLRKISQYIKEGFFKFYIEDKLNEEYMIKPFRSEKYTDDEEDDEDYENYEEDDEDEYDDKEDGKPEKIGKEYVEYTDETLMKNEKCENCGWFNGQKCNIVKGKIDKEGWCKLWGTKKFCKKD
jgi:ankyrin repeat protein